MLEVALSLAQGTNAKITMLYASEDDPSVESQQVYRELARISQGNPRIKQELRVEDNVLSAILDHLDGHDLVILGASEAEPGHQAQGVGEIPRKLQLREVGPFMVVRTHRPPPQSHPTRVAGSASADRQPPMV